MMWKILTFLAGLWLTATPPAAAETPNFITLATRAGVEQRFALVEPEKPVANVILLAGGLGLIVTKKGELNGNFLVRSRDAFASHGLRLAIVDAPSDRRSSGLSYFRASNEHATDIAAVVAWLKQRQDLPVWLIGTSRGSVSAAHLVAKLPPGSIAGIVLTSSVTVVTRSDSDTVLTAALDKITVPVLIVNHHDDKCFAAPPSDADTIARRLTASPRVEKMVFTGGSPAKSDDCEAFAPHGYIGIEDKVVADIAAWILK